MAISSKNLHLQGIAKDLLRQLGEDSNRDGLKETPIRYEEAMKYLLGGYDRDFDKENKLFENLKNYNDIIILKNIDFFSICEHHLLPFFGYFHIGYIPNKRKVLGISKLARAVDIYARRLQDQESLGCEVADVLMKKGQAEGVAILIEARHLCNISRGVEKTTSVMCTNVYLGKFKENFNLQNRFLELIKKRKTI